MKHPSWVALLVVAAAAAARAQTIVVQPPFDTDYSALDLKAVPSLPSNAGGLTFVPGDSSTLLIGGAANSSLGKIYSIGVTRGVDGHINGFNGTATFFANAPGLPGSSRGIDGGLAFGPGGILFYTSYSDNSIGQLKPGSTNPDSQIALSSLPTPIQSSVGSLAFVPPGFAGAGRFKVVQYDGFGNWYDVTLAPNAGGTYDITGVTFVVAIGHGPEGFIYVKAGSPQFSADSILVSEYGNGSVSAYESDANGDPVVATRRTMLTGLTGAEGAVVDPETGDFLFSTFGGGNRVIAVRGFLPPPSTTTTTIGSTSTSSTSTTLATTTSTSLATTTSSSTSITTTTSTTTTTATTPPCAPIGQGCFGPIVCCAGLLCDAGVCVSPTTITTTSTSTSTPPSTTSTTSTTVPGNCASVPVGPTFASIQCRLDALVTATTVSAPALGNLADKVLNALDKAGQRLDDAATECGASDTKHAGSDLKKLVRKLIQYSHKLRTKSARKKIAEEVREPLAQAGDQLQESASELRDTLACPGDAS